MSKKLPALHFYPGDWWKDNGVMALNLDERGAWLQILLMMFESPRRGYLELDSGPYPTDALAGRLGTDEEKMLEILDKILKYNVASLEKKTDILYSRRMVKDEKARQTLENNGKKGGRPNNQNNNLEITKKKPNANQNPEVENEYESIIKELKDDEPINQDLAFEVAWKYYPERIGKKGAKRSFKATVFTKADWLRHVHAFNEYVAHVESKRNGGQKLQWQNGSTWFNNWEDWAKKAEVHP